jgi:glycosyltransferase involved in cell wall biosynthesis
MSEQTLEDIEFVIVDDGSTDETYAILAAYRDRRFRLVRNAQNIGLTRSLNKGLQVARGEYVARIGCR